MFEQKRIYHTIIITLPERGDKFMNFRTDLALERREYFGGREPDGVISRTEKIGDVTISRIEITNEKGEKSLGKPRGMYVTAEVPPFTNNAPLDNENTETVARELSALLPNEGSVMVIGLGNTRITPDALGPKCLSMIFATRHIGGELAKSIGLDGLRSVSAIAPGVLGNTGVETGEIITGLVSRLKPAAVIAVDALAARRASRLGSTVQMCNTGIVPGSGVGNSRKAINSETVGVPVISVGVPTVVDAATLASDISGGTVEDDEIRARIGEQAQQMMVTPREIDLVIERAAKLLALAINRALQPQISAEDLMMLTAPV